MASTQTRPVTSRSRLADELLALEHAGDRADRVGASSRDASRDSRT